MSKFLQTNGPWSQLEAINNIQIQDTSFGISNKELTNISVTQNIYILGLTINWNGNN